LGDGVGVQYQKSPAARANCRACLKLRGHGQY
jgi:hypothetical protein